MGRIHNALLIELNTLLTGLFTGFQNNTVDSLNLFNHVTDNY